MLSKILLLVSLVLLALKLGVRVRLKAVARAVDRFVNIALVVILVTYAVQLGLWYYSRP